MLIDISGVTKNGELKLTLPSVNLDHRFSYKVCLRHLNFEFKQPVQSNELYCLWTDLIDLNSSNPQQSLFTFPVTGSVPTQDLRPLCSHNYLIQIFELNSAHFKIKEYYTNREVEIERFFCLIEINRLDAYGRF